MKLKSKKNLILFKSVNLESKNYQKLKRRFSIIKVDSFNDISKINKKIKDKVVAIYCSQKFNYNNNLRVFKNLKFLLSSTTATTFIDNKYCIKKKIKIISLEKETNFLNKITPTAEHVFGLIIMISRNYLQAIKSVETGKKFDRSPFAGFKMLSRSTLGIIGYGRLGRIVKKIAIGFGMKVIYADIKQNNFKENLNKIFLKSDFVTLHMPHRLNKCFFSKKNIKIQKPFFLINTSRGEVVDENFIIYLLKNRNLLGYATDVLKEEFRKNFSIEKNLIFKNLNKFNIIITPHIGGSTIDAWYLTQKRVIDKFIKYYSTYSLNNE
jgi:phosphoglycerate dehydrogenase-like enzyme